MVEAIRQLIRGGDVAHHIISPTPDENGRVTLAPGDELVTQVTIPAGDPLLRASNGENLLQTRRSRVAIAGERHDADDSSRINRLPDGSLQMTQGSRNHNRTRSILVKEGAELSALYVLPENEFAMQNAALLKLVQNMRVPKESPQPVLLDANRNPYSLSEAQQLLQEGRSIRFVEVGIPLQERIAIFSQRDLNDPIELSSVRRAWQGLEEDIGITWQTLNEETGQQAIEQGVILQLTVPLIIPKGYVGVIQNGSLKPGEPEHGDSVVLSPDWKDGELQEIITEHYVHEGQTGIVIPRMIRVKLFEDSSQSAEISHAFRS